MGGKLRKADEIIAAIATRAQGVVTRPELLAAGLSPKQIDSRIAKGLLIVVYRGVYRVGHTAWSVEAQYTAATKATDGVLYRRSAGHLLRLLKSRFVERPEVLTSTERRVPGIDARRTKTLDRRDVTAVSAIACTTVPRTLVDLAAVLDEDALARACHEAGVLYGTAPRQVDAVLRRLPNAKGAAALRAIMSGEVKVSLSKLERAFLELLARHGLPLPITNKLVDGRRIDCRWPDHRLTVELDGWRFHNSRHSWEQGNQRERQARIRGERFRRFTYADVLEDPAYMLAELRKLLAA
jgi:very-short-patch-repair endonuclease